MLIAYLINFNIQFHLHALAHMCANVSGHPLEVFEVDTTVFDVMMLGTVE